MFGACSNDTVTRLLQYGKSVYLSDTRRWEESAGVFRPSAVAASPGFFEREGIRSVAGIALRSDCGEVVGVMFVNYRQQVDVTRLREPIEAFAQAATSAIHHARLLQLA